MINRTETPATIQDPLIGEYAKILRSEYVSNSMLQEWELTCRFEDTKALAPSSRYTPSKPTTPKEVEVTEKTDFVIKVFGEIAVKLAQCGLVLEVGKSQDFSKAPWLFVIGYDAKHNRRAIQAIDTAQGLKVLADLPRRAPVESEAPSVFTGSDLNRLQKAMNPETVTAPQITIVPAPQTASDLPATLADKLALLKKLADSLLEVYAVDSQERSYAAMLRMDVAMLTGERMAAPKRERVKKAS